MWLMVKYFCRASSEAVVPALLAETTQAPGLWERGGGAGIEQPLKQGEQGAVGGGVVDGGAHDQAVRLQCLSPDFIAGVAVEDAAAQLPAFAAGDTAVNSPGPDPGDFRAHAVFFQGFGNLRQGGGKYSPFDGGFPLMSNTFISKTPFRGGCSAAITNSIRLFRTARSRLPSSSGGVSSASSWA